MIISVITLLVDIRHGFSMLKDNLTDTQDEKNKRVVFGCRIIVSLLFLISFGFKTFKFHG